MPWWLPWGWWAAGCAALLAVAAMADTVIQAARECE
jgi:hypothetical protein